MINSHTSYLESFVWLDFNFQSQVAYWLIARIFLELYYLPMITLVFLDKIGPPEDSLIFS